MLQLLPRTPVLRRSICPAAYLLCALLAAFIVVNAGSAAADYGLLYQHFSPASRADAKLKSLLELLSLGLYKGGTQGGREVEQILHAAEKHERYADMGAWALFGATGAFLAFVLAPWRRGQARLTPGFMGHLLGVSLIYLVVGLLAPILSLVAYTDVAVLGKVVFRYESKGIITTVVELVGSGNVFIAAVLFTFSVVTPLVKLVFTFMAISTSRAALRHRYLALLGAIGKWSMADVLVVAILLSFFISGSDEFSDSWLGPGLYFFAGYCLLSLIAVQLIGHVPASPRPPRPAPRALEHGDDDEPA